MDGSYLIYSSRETTPAEESYVIRDCLDLQNLNNCEKLQTHRLKNKFIINSIKVKKGHSVRY